MALFDNTVLHIVGHEELRQTLMELRKMSLDEYWFARADVEKFVRILEKLGYDWDIDDLMEKPTLRIWKSSPKRRCVKDMKIAERKGFHW